jgi:methylthioribose-1-phosphate isomerase
MKEPLLMRLENNVYLDDGNLIMVDRRKIPREVVYVVARNYEEVAQAIKDMVVQGAGDIAITAGFGLYLAAKECEDANKDCAPDTLAQAAAMLRETRPTGFHMAVLLEKALQRVQVEKGPASEVILNYLKGLLTRQDDVSRATGKFAETLLESGDTILTHCFAGAGLLYMLKCAQDKGKDIKVICTETRPYLQGARLTSWSISRLGLDTTLITDNMAAHIMSQGMIDKVFTAADRIAMDGTVANKVGTLQLAIAAKFYNIPFYILGYGGVDTRTLRGTEIPIEQRDPKEVLEFQGVPISGEDVKALYPAFDLTPRELITGVVTKAGIILND